ncbi:hypothetical protein EDB84DRAFT_1564060 [Lactarius hengduanensis]|nr:hypothetical protein EDB84DRAFT_1564060 [Lactarius hengduanensis]
MSSTSAPSAAGPSTSTALSAPFYHLVDLSLQRPLDPQHAKDIMPMYSSDTDLRTHDPLDCVVDIGDKDKVDQWVKEQDPKKLTTSFLEDMLVLDLSDTSYVIVKGCLAVKLYHSDPKDINRHRLFTLAVHDNLPTVKKDADAHSLGQCVMRNSWAEISGALSHFHDLDFHNHLGQTMRKELYVIYQVSLTPKAQSLQKAGASDRRIVQTWAACKMFLDHTLLEALIELNDNSFGQNFSITVASLESLFNKVEWLPFLAVLFRDIFEVVKDFKTSEGDSQSKGLLNELFKAYSSKRLDAKKWPKVGFEAWLLKAEEFEAHWFDFKHLSYNALIGAKKDFQIAADCFRMPKDMEEEEEEEEEEEKEKEEAQQKEQVDEDGDKEPEGEKEKEDASEDGGADEGGEKSKGKEEVQVAQQKEQVDKEGDKEPEGEKEKEVASEDGGADEGGEKSKGKEEVQVAQPKEQVGEEEDTEPEGEKEKENASEDGGTDEGGEKGKGKEVAAPAHMDEDEEEHAGGEEAEKVAHSQKDMSQGEGDKEGQEKEVTKKRQASTEEGSSKRAKFDPPAPSTQQPTQGSYAGEATQEPIYSIDELKKANSPFCLPYMDWAMPEEEIRKYLISFINDKRIPAQTLFNLFQASIKLYNVGGGSRDKGIWDYDPDTPREQITIKHTFNDTDMTFDPDEIDGRISATYPGEEEDVEMED